MIIITRNKNNDYNSNNNDGQNHRFEEKETLI